MLVKGTRIVNEVLLAHFNVCTIHKPNCLTNESKIHETKLLFIDLIFRNIASIMRTNWNPVYTRNSFHFVSSDDCPISPVLDVRAVYIQPYMTAYWTWNFSRIVKSYQGTNITLFLDYWVSTVRWIILLLPDPEDGMLEMSKKNFEW